MFGAGPPIASCSSLKRRGPSSSAAMASSVQRSPMRASASARRGAVTVVRLVTCMVQVTRDRRARRPRRGRARPRLGTGSGSSSRPDTHAHERPRPARRRTSPSRSAARWCTAGSSSPTRGRRRGGGRRRHGDAPPVDGGRGPRRRSARAVYALADPGGPRPAGHAGYVAGGAIEHTAPLPRGVVGRPARRRRGRLLGLNTVRLEGGFILAPRPGPAPRRRPLERRRARAAAPRPRAWPARAPRDGLRARGPGREPGRRRRRRSAATS